MDDPKKGPGAFADGERPNHLSGSPQKRKTGLSGGAESACARAEGAKLIEQMTCWLTDLFTIIHFRTGILSEMAPVECRENCRPSAKR